MNIRSFSKKRYATKTNTSFNFNKYFFDLLIIFIWIIVSFAAAIIQLENVYITAILTIPVVLFIPGYATMAAFFPRNDDIEIVERVVLSIGLSLALIPILGLLSNFTFGLNLISMIGILFIYMVIIIIIAIYRRNKQPKNFQFSVEFNKTYESVENYIRPKNKIDAILTILLLFVIVSTIGSIYNTATAPKKGENFTEFYVVNPSGKSYPNDLEINIPTELLVGVTNHEYSRTYYTLRVLLDNNTLVNKELTLNNGDAWKGNITLIRNSENSSNMVDFLLFKDNNFEAPYRSLHLWERKKMN